MLARIREFMKKTMKFHKKKIGFAIVCFFAFFILGFPYDDLSDFVTGAVSKATGDQVFLQFDGLGFDVLPTPGIEMENVSVDVPNVPTLKADTLDLKPSLTSLLAFRKGFSASAEGFMKGDVDISYHDGAKIADSDSRWINISLDTEDIDIAELKKAFPIPIDLFGKLGASLSAEYDPNFREQPKADLNLDIASFRLPNSTINTQFGPTQIPEIKMARIKVVGRLAGNDFIIDEGKLGENSDQIFGRIKGRLGVTLQPRGSAFEPVWGSYDIQVDLNLKKGVSKDIRSILSLMQLDRFKSETLNGSRYLFRASTANFYTLPNYQAISSF